MHKVNVYFSSVAVCIVNKEKKEYCYIITISKKINCQVVKTATV